MKNIPRHGKEQVQRLWGGAGLGEFNDEHSMQNGMTATERSWRSMRGDEVVETGRGPV